MEQEKQREAAEAAEAAERAKKPKSPKAGSKMTNRPKTGSKSPPTSPKAGSRVGSANKKTSRSNSQVQEEKKSDPKIQKANNSVKFSKLKTRMSIFEL